MTARTLIPALAVACLVSVGCDRVPTDPAGLKRTSSITNGTVDGDAHPAVVLIVMDVGGQPAFGPNYLGSSNVIAAVTSFGLNQTCGGTGGVFRLDRQDVLDFVGQFLN